MFCLSRVFHNKERDIVDGEIDAQITTRQKSAESLKIWVGKDYVNFIFKDFVDLDHPFTGLFSVFLFVSLFFTINTAFY